MLVWATAIGTIYLDKPMCAFMHKCKSMIFDDKMNKAQTQGRNHTTNFLGLAICSQSLSTLVFGSLLDRIYKLSLSKTPRKPGTITKYL